MEPGQHNTAPTLEIVANLPWYPVPKAAVCPAGEVHVLWSPVLEARLRETLKAYRRAPEQQNVGTPELLELARKREKELEDRTLKLLRLQLVQNPPPTIDLDVLGACDRLAKQLRQS